MFPHLSVQLPFRFLRLSFSFRLLHSPSLELPLHFQALSHLGSWAIDLAYLRHAAIAPVLAEVADLASVFCCHRASWQACRSTSHPHFTLGRVPCQALELLGIFRFAFVPLTFRFGANRSGSLAHPASLAGSASVVKRSNYSDSLETLSLCFASSSEANRAGSLASPSV